jgi:LAO/AO transport system kinase
MQAITKSLFEGVLSGSRLHLARCITLLESSRNEDIEQSIKLLDSLYDHLKKNKANLNAGPSTPHDLTFEDILQKKSIRIGISGPPGAGKSTFIEAFGNFLLQELPTLHLAALTIDPSSKESGGSILGDKTRMPLLSTHPRAFIRPSPTRGYLGGTTRSTHEALILCQAAGYPLIFVETVGVGQSETAAFDMTDLFLLLEPPAGGDELQVS